MTYRLSMAVDANLCLEIEESDFSDLLELFEKMGGDRDWLMNTARASVARSLHGDPVGNIARSMGGELIAEEENAADTGRTQGTARSAQSASESNGHAATTQTAPHSDDPWASDAQADKEWPGEAAVERQNQGKPQKSDPWDNSSTDEPEQKPRQRSQNASSTRDDGVTSTRDKFGREWTLGLDDAPDCDCGERSARMKAKSKAGKYYTVWKCAKAAGSDYRDKCEFSEFPN